MEEVREQAEAQGIGSVGESFLGFVVDFDEDSVHAYSYGCRCERFDELRLASGGGASSAGELHAVGRVEDDGPAGIGHDFQATHVYYQIVVTEG